LDASEPSYATSTLLNTGSNIVLDLTLGYRDLN
jgi:hypothetical protein